MQSVLVIYPDISVRPIFTAKTCFRDKKQGREGLGLKFSLCPFGVGGFFRDERKSVCPLKKGFPSASFPVPVSEVERSMFRGKDHIIPIFLLYQG